MESNRLAQAPASVSKWVQESLKSLKKQKKSIDKEIAQLVLAEAKNARRVEIMLSAKGIGLKKAAGIYPRTTQQGKQDKGKNLANTNRYF